MQARLGRLAVPLGALLLALLLQAGPWQARWQTALDDALLQQAGRPVALDEVLVLDIDEDAVRRLQPQLGDWPYRRDAYALLIGYLREAGVRAVAIDLVLADARDGDDALRRSLHEPGAPVVLAAAAWQRPAEVDRGGAAPTPSPPTPSPLPADAPATVWPALLSPAATLQARHVGLVTLPLDADGRLRRLPLLHDAAGIRLPALPVVLLQARAGGAALGYDNQARQFRLQAPEAPAWLVDRTGRARLPPVPTDVPHLPFHAVAAAALGLGEAPGLRQRLAGRTVFIGGSVALGNPVPTPAGPRAGTDWLAASHAALAQGRVLAATPPASLLPMLLLAMVPGLLAARGRKPPWREALLGGALAAALLGAAAWGLHAHDRLLPVLLPLEVLVLGLLLGLLAQQARLRKANRRLQLQRAVAEAASAAKGEFLASMSHELRTPLNGVIGAAQLMRDHGDDPQRREELAEIIRSSGSHLLSLVDGVLQLARIEAGALELVRESFNLVDCVDAVMATAAVPARSKGLQIAAVIEPSLAAWRIGDPMRLRQVLVNLIGNAVKFTHRGEVVLRIEPGAGDELALRVIDTGIGLDAAAQARIFEPFRQADRSTPQRFGGSGLGLTICRRLVDAMHGTIAVDSTPGRGTCFTVCLPLPAAAEQPSAAALGWRVGFVEPHEASAEGLAALLGRMGCEALRCRSADDLQALFARPDALGRAPWLLVATDSDDALTLLESAADWVAADRVIGMTHLPWYAAEQARERGRLPRSVLKPVLRSALVSRFGAGSRRVRPPAAGQDAGAAPIAVPPAITTRVLIVEDDPVNQAIVAAMLDQAGFETRIAGDGRTALQLFERHAFDVLLMDWQMPDMDGIEVTRRLRAGEAGPLGRRVPVVALTANAFAEDRAACLAAGMNDFLTKPVVAEDLVTAIARWAPGRH